MSTLAEAPIVHLKLAEPSGDRFEDEKTLQAIVDEALEQGMRCSPFSHLHPTTHQTLTTTGPRLFFFFFFLQVSS